jgi:DNA repair photolyase
LRFQKRTIKEAVFRVTNKDFNPHDAGDLAIAYENVVEALDDELTRKGVRPGAGKTLVYSQLTDGFSPVLLNTGTARQILELLVEKTQYRIRVLTKNAIVGRPKWIDFFAKHKDRFVVGLSIGTLDTAFAQNMEWRTSAPLSRIKALNDLQDAGIPTFGMLCPVFPQILDTDELEKLIDLIRPDLCEYVWAEPYNERDNWTVVRSCFVDGSPMWQWMTQVFDCGKKEIWSGYAKNLYSRILDAARRGGWADKLRYLLYEDLITAEDAEAFRNLDGVLLQCKTDEEGLSRNRNFAEIQMNLNH